MKDPLDLLFENLKATLKFEGHYKEGSCLISLAFEMRGNKRGEIINESGIILICLVITKHFAHCIFCKTF